ncbi:Gfo/Idh/MocA family protein [Ktedonobacter racemifer]|uniref:Oxidoreductase domain protein n=1 Tax=Ktedonobacter racemifer DSM 44963 TaxID=485913 RepID=D6U6F2_KTERA|nr:Gfo/Idh/MocA family oxidoreductase [Ktedonobacter racemifer]EFH80563.1 oxidoreductase domain protein [Ktedonobacter racemifer DSM 44963]
MGKVNIGIIGCGAISSIYLEAPEKFDILNITACADIDLERAQAQAAKYHVPKVYTVEELLADPEIDIVLNLTIPKVHAEIARAAIAAGKSTYSEKPLGINRTEASALLEEAREKKLLVGCAPDTFLGGGLQTCIKLIDDGAIGAPIASTAFMLGHGPENWHPNPDFYYQLGGGPMFDMGPYYLTALIAMMGPVRRVTGSTRITFPERKITSQPFYGQTITVNTPTHVTGTLDFASGAIGTIITSFDVWSHRLPLIEIYGTEGTLSVPDPNTFGGPVRVRRFDDKEWRDVELTHGNTVNSRGIGIADMAHALQSGSFPHRASGELAYHVLDIMQAIHDSSNEGKHIELSSQCERPLPLPVGPKLW